MTPAGRNALFGIALALVAGVVGVYLLNPFQASGWDPRARIAGHVPYRMPSLSMQPTLGKGEVFLAEAGHYRRHPPARFDVALFEVPDHGTWVARIVALPGESVALRDGRLHIDGVAQSEPFVHADNMREDYSLAYGPTTVPAGHVFVMGDNRDNAADSRFRGPVAIADLSARARLQER